MSSDPNDFDFGFYDEEPDYDDPDLEEEEGPSPEIFGMSMVEIGILAVLLIAILIFTGFIILNSINKSRAENTPQVTQATPTLTPSVTPFVKSTPIPDWNQFEFSDTRAEIWLPNNCQGGDPIAYPEILDMTIDVFMPNESYATFAKEFVDDSPMVFFAFDPDPNSIWRSMYVRQDLLKTTAFDMETHLNQIVGQTSGRNIRVTNQYLNDLDYYRDVGVLIFEEHKELVEGEIYLFKIYVFAIPIEDEIWHLEYQVLRDDAAKYQETIFNSARSFYVQP